MRKFVETNAPGAVETWPLRSWDLRLLTLAALYYHPDVEMALAKLAAAKATLITAGVRPNPTFAFSPTYSGPPLEFFSPWTLGFTLDVPIETAGKRGYRIAQAQHLANAARLDLASTAWHVRSRVRSSLLDLRAAEVNQELLGHQERLQKQTVELLEERLQAGQSSLFEVQLVRIGAAQTALQLREAQRQSAQARVRLANALGLPVSAVTNIVLSYATLEQLPRVEDNGSFRQEALLNRSDILAALAEYEASQAALQLEIAKQYPDIQLGPGYTWNQGVNNYSLGVSLTLPILNQNQGPIAEAEAHRQEAAAAFLALQARVIGEVDAALAGYGDAVKKLQAADSLLEDQRQRMQLMRESFAAGAADRLELLQTELELSISELSRANALLEVQQAVGTLEDSVRRPIDQAGVTQLPSALLKPQTIKP